MENRGKCACGEVEFRVDGTPLIVHCCHCGYCQRETGSAFVINALIEFARVHVKQGNVDTVITPTASGAGQRVVRCKTCQVALWSQYAYGAIKDYVVFVRVGTLLEPDSMPPDIHIFTESKQDWVQLPDDAVAVPKFYKASQHWPEESLARRKSLFDALETKS